MFRSSFTGLISLVLYSSQLSGSELPDIRDEADHAQKIKSQIETLGPCLPILTSRAEGWVRYSEHCTRQSFSPVHEMALANSVVPVPSDLHPRILFWSRVYSLYDIHDYILHDSHYPEVVYEVINVDEHATKHGEEAAKELAKRLLRKRIAYYRNILEALRKNKDEPATPEQVHIKSLFDHRPDGYKDAARSIRIQRGQRSFIRQGMGRFGKYRDAILQEFREVGVPEELAEVAFVESSFNPRAYSKVGAAGAYQIMPATGKQYMTINDWIDKRKDPIYSARTAAKLFALNHRILGDSWPLAITAYNHGVGGMRNAVRTMGTDRIEEIIQRYTGNRFGFASKNFFSEFIGVRIAIRNPAMLRDLEIEPPINFESVKLDRAMLIRELAAAHGTSIAVLKDLNPSFGRAIQRNQVPVPRGYAVRVPRSHDRKEPRT